MTNKNLVVIGTHWGDEGTGKIVDLLTESVTAVVRFQGGHNAGHTPVSYTHLRAHETDSYLVCRLLLEKNSSSSPTTSYQNE